MMRIQYSYIKENTVYKIMYTVTQTRMFKQFLVIFEFLERNRARLIWLVRLQYLLMKYVNIKIVIIISLLLHKELF